MMLRTIPGQRSCSFSQLPLFHRNLELRFEYQALNQLPVCLPARCIPVTDIILPDCMTQRNNNLQVSYPVCSLLY
jgi:hypothetical protein